MTSILFVFYSSEKRVQIRVSIFLFILGNNVVAYFEFLRFFNDDCGRSFGLRMKGLVRDIVIVDGDWSHDFGRGSLIYYQGLRLFFSFSFSFVTIGLKAFFSGVWSCWIL